MWSKKIVGLVCCLVGIVSAQLVSVPVFAQTNNLSAPAGGAALGFDVQVTQAEVGKPISLPLLLNTNGQTIDGVQLAWQFQGVTVSDTRLQLVSDLPFIQVKNEVDASHGSLNLVPSNPLTPYATSTSTKIADLLFTPTTEGTLTIAYDSQNTLVASHETSQNILTASSPQSLVIESGVPKVTSAPLTAQPTANTKLSLQAMLPVLAIVVVLVFVGVAAVFLMKRSRSQVTVPTVVPTANSSAAPVTQSAAYSPPVAVSPPEQVINRPESIPVMSQDGTQTDTTVIELPTSDKK